MTPQARFRFERHGNGYLVRVGFLAIGYVWRTKSGRVWGELSCSRNLPVWAWSESGWTPQGSAETRQKAAEQLRSYVGKRCSLN